VGQTKLHTHANNTQNYSSVHLKYLYFWIVNWKNDPESYAGDSIATGMAFPATKGKGDDPNKRGTLVL
jgi:hypothetical protein